MQRNLSTDGMGGILKLLSFMTGRALSEMPGKELCECCRASILKQFPQFDAKALKKVGEDLDSELSESMKMIGDDPFKSLAKRQEAASREAVNSVLEKFYSGEYDIYFEGMMPVKQLPEKVREFYLAADS